MLSGGMWTAARSHLAGLWQSPLCPRCNLCWETNAHRLWECPCNEPSLQTLTASLDKYYTVAQLRNSISRSFARCAMPAAMDTVLTINDMRKVLLYLRHVANEATVVQARVHRNFHFVLQESWHLLSPCPANSRREGEALRTMML